MLTSMRVQDKTGENNNANNPGTTTTMRVRLMVVRTTVGRTGLIVITTLVKLSATTDQYCYCTSHTDIAISVLKLSGMHRNHSKMSSTYTPSLWPGYVLLSLIFLLSLILLFLLLLIMLFQILFNIVTLASVELLLLYCVGAYPGSRLAGVGILQASAGTPS